MDADTLVRMEIRTRHDVIEAAAGMIAGAAGLALERAAPLTDAVLRACRDVVDLAYGGSPDASLVLEVQQRAGELVVGIEDQGLPFDASRLASAVGGFSVRFLNRGREGQRVEMVARLPRATPRPAQQYLEAPLEIAPDAVIDLRPLRSDEALALERCFYRCYGYSYDDFVYHPDVMKDRIERGIQASFVAVAPDQEIVGHIAVMRKHPDASVAWIGQAVVVPEMRQRHLFKELKSLAMDYTREQGMDGLYSECVTMHPHSQEGNLRMGARETGVLLGYDPPSTRFRGMEGGHQACRESLVMFYTRVRQEPPQAVHVPARHGDVIEKIYQRGGFQRELLGSAAPPAGDARVDVEVHADYQMAVLTVAAPGTALASEVREHARVLLERGVRVVYLDLPMDAPAPVEDLEAVGFSFAGIVPELHGADVLRLQLLDNVAIDPDEIKTASDFGRFLLDYVMEQRRSLV